ncbi:MAG: pyridoxal-phosphate dependent enzyme [Myxococcales bacterium]|nr:pyridoxal-phosphate dependent enzyme [Myxococcales bacterium]
MGPLHIRTPVWSRQIGAALVHFKMDALQPVGSFKLRGIGRLCTHAKSSGAQRLVTSSGGNAGCAMAYAARCLGLPALVYVPSRTSEMMRAKIVEQGAEVRVAGDVWDETDAAARAAAAEPTSFYVHPFEHPEVWRGHATLIEELHEQIPRPDAIVLSVGGGGLLAGVLGGMDSVGWGEVPVLAAETHGAASLAASLSAGELVTLESITTIATTLGAKRVSPEALARAQAHLLTPLQMSDADAVRACLRFANEQRVLVEPSCGAALSLVYDRAEALAGARSIAVIVCGGAAIDLQLLASYCRRFELPTPW